MTSSEKRGFLPKLRFPEFREAGDWDEKKLADVLNPTMREVVKPSSNYLALGIRSHGKGTFHKHDQAPEKNSMDRLYLVHRDDLVVNITFAWEGAIAIAADDDHGSYVSHRFPTYVFKASVSMPAFFRYVITRKAFVYKLGLISPGGAGRNRVMNKNDFLKLSVLLPTVQEQQKIANCLASLDELITLEAQKLDTLKTHKKGVMQQLFPAEGETLPKLRFPEFRETGEWEKKTLGQVAKYENGKAHEQDIAESGEFVVVNSKFISTEGEVRKFTDTAFCIAEKDDILIVLSDVPNGRAIAKCFLVGSDHLYTVNQRICKLTPYKAVSILLFYVLNRNSYFLAFDDGVKQTNLKKDDVLDCPILLPKNLKEQRKIADCLTSLDDLITAQTQQLATLKTHKKGLMQQLFPVLDEVQE